MTLRGSCHCGRLSVQLVTEREIDQLPLRACQCTFCRRHAARTTSDPAGAIVLTVRGAIPAWYRFGMGMTDFWVCPTCGVYVGASLESGGRAYAVVNINVLEEARRFVQPPTPMDYGQETAEGRVTRRVQVWSPTRIIAAT